MSLRMETELWMHVLVIMGIVSIIRGGLLAGIVLVGCWSAPGGLSIF